MRARWRQVALAALFGLTACDGCGDRGEPAATTARVASPVPAPAGLAAEVVVPRPSALLERIREAAGGSALFLPKTLGGLTASMLGLPIQVAEVIDEQLPVVGAVVVADGAPQIAFAVHVSDPARLETFVAGGREATFTATRDGELTWLAPKSGARDPRVKAAIGLYGHYLVAGTDPAAVRALAPYLTTTLSTRESPRADVHVDVKKEAVEPLRAQFRKLAEAELPPTIASWLSGRDLAETASALTDGLGAGSIEARLSASRLEVEAQFSRSGEARSTLSPKSILDVPADVVAAVAWAERPAERARQASQRALQIREALGMADEDQALVEEALAKVSRGMGERLLLGLRCTGVGFTGLARGEIAAAGDLEEGLEALAELREHPAVESRLEGAGLSLSFKKRRLEQVPFDLFRLRLVPKDGGEASMSEIDFLYGLGEQTFVVAAGKETVETTQRLVRPDTGPTLATREPLAEALARLPDKVWLSAVVDAQGLHACTLGKPGGHPTPMVLGVGPEGETLRLRFEMSSLLMRLVADAL